MLIETRIPFKYLFDQIKNDVARVILFSLVFLVIKYYFADQLPPVPGPLPTVLGGSISLLLAFKINQSYDRWWEARKIWGAIVNDSRSWVLQARMYINENVLAPGEADSYVSRMALRQIAWCYSLGNSLRGLDALKNLAAYIAPHELEYLQQHSNKPLALLSLQTADLKSLLRQSAINEWQQIQLDSTLVRLCASMGKAERINGTVFPVTYRMFVHFTIYLFLVVLSLSLVEEDGWFEIPAMAVTASIFFLLEKTAKYLQDPFENNPTDTPVTAIARTIEINIKQLLQEESVPAPIAPEEYFIM